VDNAASNALCRKLGFVLVGETDVEYPPGHMMRCNDWRIDLTAPSPETEPAR
jgi:RimJ/RimL family protein N-acetyltransferase